MIHTPQRRASALIMIVVCLALLAVMMTAVVRQGVAQKHYLDQRERRAQAHWLAQAGIEHAAAQLLANPRQYTGEMLTIIPSSQVRIQVQPGKDSFVVTSEATYPTDEAERASISVSRAFRVVRDGTKVRLEMVD